MSEENSPDALDEVGATAGKADGSQLTDCEKRELVSYLNGGITQAALRSAGVHLAAARNLVEHRDGSDGQFGTADDDLFDSIDEVDAVPYVGPAAFRSLVKATAARCLLLDLTGTCSTTTTSFSNGYGYPQTISSPIALQIRLDAEDASLALPRPVTGKVVVASPWGQIPDGLWRGWCHIARFDGQPPDAACAIGPFEISTASLGFGEGYSYFKHEDAERYSLVIGAGYESGRDSYYDNNYSRVRYSCSLE